jgi:hypothetical protein
MTAVLHHSAALSLQKTTDDSIFLEEAAAPLITKSISFLLLSKLFIPAAAIREPFG